jgi:hypothetical protein
MKPFSLEFNVAVVAMASRVCPTGYDVTDDPRAATVTNAKAYFAEVTRCKRITVFTGNSERTIFGGPENAEINWAFRAWHEWTHWYLGAPFNLVGETRVAEQQWLDLQKVYGAAFAAKYKPLLYAEVIGQALAYEMSGEFPDDQRAFDNLFLAYMGAATKSNQWVPTNVR